MCIQSFQLQVPDPHADRGAEGVVDDVIRFAPAHLEQILGGFSGDETQTADEDNVLGFEFRKEDRDKTAKRIVEKDAEDGTFYRQ